VVTAGGGRVGRGRAPCDSECELAGGAMRAPMDMDGWPGHMWHLYAPARSHPRCEGVWRLVGSLTQLSNSIWHDTWPTEELRLVLRVHRRHDYLYLWGCTMRRRGGSQDEHGGHSGVEPASQKCSAVSYLVLTPSSLTHAHISHRVRANHHMIDMVSLPWQAGKDWGLSGAVLDCAQTATLRSDAPYQLAWVVGAVAEA
jgi:hypothetical protein